MNDELSHGLLRDPSAEQDATNLPEGLGIAFSVDAALELLDGEGMMEGKVHGNLKQT